MMELIADTRHALAQSRVLMAEADALIARAKLLCLAECKDPKVRP